MNVDCLFVAKLRFGVGGSFAEQKKTYEQVGCNRIENGAALWDDLHEKYQTVFTMDLGYREQDDDDDYYCAEQRHDHTAILLQLLLQLPTQPSSFATESLSTFYLLGPKLSTQPQPPSFATELRTSLPEKPILFVNVT